MASLLFTDQIQMYQSVLTCFPSKMSLLEFHSIAAHRGVCFIYTKEVTSSVGVSDPKGPQQGKAFVLLFKAFAFPHNSLYYIICLKLCCSGISSVHSVRSISIIVANMMKNRQIIHFYFIRCVYATFPLVTYKEKKIVLIFR